MRESESNQKSQTNRGFTGENRVCAPVPDVTVRIPKLTAELELENQNAIHEAFKQGDLLLRVEARLYRRIEHTESGLHCARTKYGYWTVRAGTVTVKCRNKRSLKWVRQRLEQALWNMNGAIVPEEAAGEK